MSRDSTVIRLRQPEAIDDPLSELAREGARRMLAQVLIAEADCFVAMWKALKLPDGRDRVVRHGHGPHRAIQTGLGPVEVRRAKVRDQGRTHMNSTEATNINVVRKYFAGCGDGQQALGLVRAHHQRNLLRFADVINLGGKIQSPQRHAEQEPQPGHHAVAIANADSGLGQVQLE